MRKFCSVHTHSLMCDGKNTLAEMARAACEAGVASFGASGHSHTPIPEDAGCVLPADMTAYRGEVLRLRAEYAGRMDVLLGIELDNCADVSPEGFDYWIGSAHRLKGPEGQFYTVDWDAETLAACCETAFSGDGCAMAERYYEEVCRMAAMGPTILGHIDLITKFNEGTPLFDEDSPRYRAAALAALHAADPQATLLEINTGAMSRGYRHTPYPALFLLEEWRTMGGRVILTADAHSAAAIVFGYDRAAALARAAGFGCSAVLTAAGAEERPL
ncbi:histidinol-phosphatase HisJ family protein [uncultured Oscillibacter sp.]|uniref:histidinol-phosphatase HisJ family protein n=1 Tax=uncultured Oscillibacter sp. TaxID=876091 RepID=UPI0025DE89DE|nr:histidinol-phosphatase HisJ family protein [uncultured Oscillibacter sp.]